VRRWLLLIATLVPLAYMLLFVGAFAAVRAGGDDFLIGPVGVVLHLATIFWSMGLLAIYVLDVLRNPKLDETLRIVWTVSLVLATIVAMLVYWWLYLRRGERHGAGAPAGLQNR
jgi:hypothetical protein